MTSREISLSEYFGFDPNSPYADLFSNIYHLTKVSSGTNAASLEEEEEGEIIEIDNSTEASEPHSRNDCDQLTGDEEYNLPLLLDRESTQCPPDENWKEGWMRISKDAISWNQRFNQNSLKQHLQVPPTPPPPASYQYPQFSSRPTHISSLNVFQGTNQINSNIFTNASGGVAKIPDFAIPPPPIQAKPWGLNPFSLPSLQNLPRLTDLPPLPPLPPPPLVAQEQGRGGGSNFGPEHHGNDTKEKRSKGLDLRIQFDLDDNPVRIEWLIKYMDFQAKVGKPLIDCPYMYNGEPLDLFKLFNSVMDEGGFHHCTAKKSWRKVSEKMTANHRQANLWRMLQKLYRRMLLNFENFEREVTEDQREVAEDLSMPKLEEERSDLQEVQRVERKALLPLPVGGANGQQWGGGGGAQWGAIAPHFSEQAGQVLLRDGGGRKGRKKEGNKINK